MMPEFDKASTALQDKMDALLSIADKAVADTVEHLRNTISTIETQGDGLVSMTTLLGVVGTAIAAGIGVLAIIWIVRPVGHMTEGYAPVG
jgi:hypothetical protein